MKTTAVANPEHRLKSAEEMCALFADLPEAVENTVEITQRCVSTDRTRPDFAGFLER